MFTARDIVPRAIYDDKPAFSFWCGTSWARQLLEAGGAPVPGGGFDWEVEQWFWWLDTACEPCAESDNWELALVRISGLAFGVDDAESSLA